MAKTYVCEQCGRRFTPIYRVAKRQGSNRYICPSCYRKYRRQTDQERKMQSQALANYRLQTTGMKQSRFAMVCKIAFGILMIVSMIVPNTSTGQQIDVTTKFGGIIVGIICILWGWLPYRRAKKNGF